MRVILDTNVVVAAIRSRHGASAALLRLLSGGEFSIAISAPLVFEYEEVLVRELVPAFVSLEGVDQLIRLVCMVGEKHEPERKFRPALPDPDDDFIVELAAAAGIEYIVTHNVQDFRNSGLSGINAITPSRFLHLLKGES